MNKNPVLLSLLSLIFAAMLWYGIPAAYHLHEYYSLTKTTEPTDIKWFVDEISSEDFRVGATYSYIVDAATHQGETIFNDMTFRNPSTADDELKVKATKTQVVFYDPQNADHSSLQKKFPTKECVSTAVLFLIFLYFALLGIYTSSLNTKNLS